MSDRTQIFCYLSLHSCSNSISFTSAWTRASGLGPLKAWMVHEIFACLVYLWGTITYNYYIFESKLSPNNFRNSLMTCRYQVSCKQYHCLQVQRLLDKKHSQIKAIYTFEIESVSLWFLNHYIYITDAIVIKLHDARTRYVFWLLNLLFVSLR